MTTVTTHTAVPFGAVAIFNLVSKIDAARIAFLTWNARRIAGNDMARLSNAQMTDIGLTFEDVRQFPR